MCGSISLGINLEDKYPFFFSEMMKLWILRRQAINVLNRDPQIPVDPHINVKIKILSLCHNKTL